MKQSICWTMYKFNYKVPVKIHWAVQVSNALERSGRS